MNCSYFWYFTANVESAYDIHRKRIMKKFDLSSVEVDCLIFLINNPSLDKASDIVKARKMSKSHVSLAVNHLIELGLLEVHKEDKNKKNLHLIPTLKSEEFKNYARSEQDLFLRNVLEGISKEEKEVYDNIMQKILANVTRNYDSKKEGI